MNIGTAFWDSSALVPLCFPEAGSQAADELASQFTPVVWWATPVEIESALARKLRSGLLSDYELQRAAQLFGKLADRWEMVPPSNELRANARSLLKQFDLRAADALQLAAAMEWRTNPARDAFITGDRRLLAAAVASGFDVKSI